MKKIALLAVSLLLVACGEDSRNACAIATDLESVQAEDQLDKAIGNVDHIVSDVHNYVWERNGVYFTMNSEADVIYEKLISAGGTPPAGFVEAKANDWTVEEIINMLGEPQKHFVDRKLYRIYVTPTYSVAIETDQRYNSARITERDGDNPCLEQ